MDLLIEKSFSDDIVFLKHPSTHAVVAQRVRRNGVYVWRSEYSDIQKLCDDWARGTTIGGMTLLIAEWLSSRQGEE